MKLTEAYIKAENGNIYYTKNSNMFLSMVKSIFISNNKAVRVYYDTIKQMYVFGNAFDYIHADLANGMKYYSNIYGPDEMRANVSYLRQNCALFQVLPDDDFKKYDVGDGYTDGWFLKIDDLIFACRNKQYHKLRDEVPLFKDHIGEWIPTDYYIAKKQGLTETVDPKLNDNFWKWFGNSKVVDDQGKPLVVFHGWNKDFKEFILQDRDVKGMKCAFFSSDIDTAASYSEFGNVRDFYLKIENPLIYDANYSQYYIGKDNNHIMVALNKAKNSNYDGIIVKNIRDDSYQEYEEGYELPYSTTYIVFNPNQIKSVNNNGEWSITSNNINESVEDKILYIIRGIPGSGKSTLAHKLTNNVVEADQYFYDGEGNYNWSADKLNQAHNWCYNTVKKYMEEGRDKIAVANTFVKNRDYKRYVELAEQFGYKVDIRVCNGNYKNIHNVPDETVERMRSKFQETPLDESIAYVSKKDLSDIILLNPTRKELKEYKINNWRILQDIQGNYYFADAMKYIHQQMSNKLNSKGIEAVDAETDNAGIISYNILTNTFYYRLLDLLDEKDIEKEYNNSYLSKAFPNAELLQSNDDKEELDEDKKMNESFNVEKNPKEDVVETYLKSSSLRFAFNPMNNDFIICDDLHNPVPLNESVDKYITGILSPNLVEITSYVADDYNDSKEIVENLLGKRFKKIFKNHYEIII